MRISVICISSRSGGGLTVLRSLLEYASLHGSQHHWQFVISDQAVSQPNERIQIVRACEFYTGLRSRIRGEFIIGRKAVKEFCPDVVISLHNFDTLARGRFPLALYVQQALPFQQSYKLSIFNKQERSLAWRQYLLRYPILWSIRRAKVTFVQTRWLADELRNSIPFAQVHSIGIGSSTNTDVCYPKTVQERRFFYPAAASGYKNHRLLDAAIQLLGSRGVKLDGKIVLTLKEEDLKALVGTSDHSSYDFRGWMDHNEVLQTYSDSILVFPSLVESLGLPLYEARRAGVWIVAPDIAYAHEAMHGYPYVAWFNPYYAESLADAMSEAWKASRIARPRIVEKRMKNSGWDRMVNELIALNADNGI